MNDLLDRDPLPSPQEPQRMDLQEPPIQLQKSYTVKFLVTSPTGSIIFVSKCWGGRVCDKTKTSKCSLLDHLIHGDLVLADRYFDIVENLVLLGMALAIPPLTKNHNCLN